MLASSTSGKNNGTGSTIITTHIVDGKVVTLGGSKNCSPKPNFSKDRLTGPHRHNQMPVINYMAQYSTEFTTES